MKLKKHYGYFALGMFVLAMAILCLFYNALKPIEQLPIYQPSMVNHELVDSTLQHVKKYHKISDFSLINQNGDTITQNFYKDKIYVADFFFTTCQSICPIMTDNMSELSKIIADDNSILLLSHSVTPEIDSVPILKKYAEKYKINSKQWNLVTGDKKTIYDLARKSYLVAKEQPFSGEYDMIHTENFVLIDKNRRIRGFYDGTKKEEIQKLLHDISILKQSQ